MDRNEALIATAKALAGPVVAWVAEDEPLGYLIGNRTWAELAALVAVFGEVVANSEDARRVLAQVVAAKDDGEPAAFRWARWMRADDGIVDDIAVQAAVAGERPVKLSRPEQVRAAGLILAEGGGTTQIAGRLHVSWQAAAELADAATPPGDANAA